MRPSLKSNSFFFLLFHPGPFFSLLLFLLFTSLWLLSVLYSLWLFLDRDTPNQGEYWTWGGR